MAAEPASSSGDPNGIDRDPPRRFRLSRSALYIGLALAVVTFVAYAGILHFGFLAHDDPESVTRNPHVRGGLSLDGLWWAFTSTDTNWFPLTRLSHMLDYQLYGGNAAWHHLTSLLCHIAASLLLFAFLLRAADAQGLPVAPQGTAPCPAAVTCASSTDAQGLPDAPQGTAPYPAAVTCASSTDAQGLPDAPLGTPPQEPGTGIQPRPDTPHHGRSDSGIRPPQVCANGPVAATCATSSNALLPCAFVAAAFALHPLHVESVAWISERKDVLCALFWFLTLWCWTGYIRQPSRARYLLALAAFGLGLMSKPMIVTLPFLLLLLDYWPFHRPFSPKLLLEKIPFLALAGLTSALTVVAQRQGRAIRSLTQMPFGSRLENSLATYAIYLYRTIWPADLAAIYPFPAHPPVSGAVAAGLGILTVSALILRARRRYPYLLTGWFWYLGTLVPVIGLVQVGLQARADRYMYVPMVGLAILAAWAAADFLERRPRFRRLVSAAAAVLCLSWAAAASFQVRCWKDTETLFRRAITVVPGNYVAWSYLGVYLSARPNGMADGISAYRTAIAIKPDFTVAHLNLGVALLQSHHRREAIAEFETALRIDPGFAEAESALGIALSANPTDLPDALRHLEAAIRMDPGYAKGYSNLGAILLRNGSLYDAISAFESAVRLDPDSADAQNGLGAALARDRESFSDAVEHLQTALKIDPDFADAHTNLALALMGGPGIDHPGRLPEAVLHFREALRIDPGSAVAHNNLGGALMREPAGLPEAVTRLEEAVQIDPNYYDAHLNLAIALLKMPNRASDAAGHFRTALRLRPSPELRRTLDQLGIAQNPAAALPSNPTYLKQ